jgi:hypothetical protein
VDYKRGPEKEREREKKKREIKLVTKNCSDIYIYIFKI